MKLGHIRIDVRQYADGRYGFDDYSEGARRKVRLWSKTDAEKQATDLAVLLANGRDDLLAINRIELAQFRQWRKQSAISPTVAAVAQKFLDLKSRKSSRYHQSLRRDIDTFIGFVRANTRIGEITTVKIQEFLDSRNVSDRRKFNLRSEIVSLFRWARRMSYLPDRTTEAEKVEPIERRPGKPNIYTPVQMRALLEHVNPQFLPWLAIAGFAGVRSEEIAPDPLSKKSPLDWSDIIWKLRVIRIRSETSKTREEREVPLSRNLMEWLAPYKKESGPVCEGRPTNYETGRLGAFIGGWKHNALRDTYCSYRARIVRNLHQVCYEMGTSLAMAKRSYHRSQPLAPAKAYFSIRSERPGNVIKFPKNRVPKSSKKRPSTAVIRASR